MTRSSARENTGTAAALYTQSLAITPSHGGPTTSGGGLSVSLLFVTKE